MWVYKRILLLLCVVTIVLCGCQTPGVYYQTEGNVADAKQRVNDAFKKQTDDAMKPISPLVVNDGLYIDKRPIDLVKRPPWLKNHIIIRGDQLPFSYYSRTVADGVSRNIMTQYQFGLDSNAKVSMNYSGTVKGALDMLAAKTGYVYSISHNQIYWQAMVTRTFDIQFMPGTADYQMGKASGGASSPGGSGQTTGVIDDSAQTQFNTLKGSISVWDDLKNTITQLMSADGKVMVSQATTSVTVRDKPANIELIGQFIANLNASLNKQVLVKIQVLEVTLRSDFQYGINWDIIQRAMGGTNYVLTAAYGTPIAVTSFQNTPAQYGLNLTTTAAANGGTGFEALINALKEQGKVSVVTEPRLVCLNNQVSSLRIVTQAGYLASVQNTTVAGASGGGSAGTITSQITPGTLVTGLTLYVLPKIMGQRVHLQVNADLSNNLGFGNVSSTPAGSTNTNSQQIQVPNVTQKQFNQRSVIASGDTLILAGFRQLSNTANAVQLADSQALGGRGSLQESAETVILITPIILNGSA